jgi:hypothetical protein
MRGLQEGFQRRHEHGGARQGKSQLPRLQEEERETADFNVPDENEQEKLAPSPA